jgi:hypothetical protein
MQGVQSAELGKWSNATNCDAVSATYDPLWFNDSDLTKLITDPCWSNSFAPCRGSTPEIVVLICMRATYTALHMYI